MTNKYQREIKPGVFVDVYDVIRAFQVHDPAMAHAVKKCLAAGQRGHKDSIQDKEDILASVKRSIEMEREWTNPSTNGVEEDNEARSAHIGLSGQPGSFWTT